MESYNKREFEQVGIREEFVQDNHSRSVRGVIRGLHYQRRYPQGKLIRGDCGVCFGRGGRYPAELTDLRPLGRGRDQRRKLPPRLHPARDGLWLLDPARNGPWLLDPARNSLWLLDPARDGPWLQCAGGDGGVLSQGDGVLSSRGRKGHPLGRSCLNCHRLAGRWPDPLRLRPGPAAIQGIDKTGIKLAKKELQKWEILIKGKLGLEKWLFIIDSETDPVLAE
jgi:hypothetical protein